MILSDSTARKEPAVDVRQWCFDGEGDPRAQVLPGRPLVLRTVPEPALVGPAGVRTVVGAAVALTGDRLTLVTAPAQAATVLVRRPGTSGDPLRHGERFGLRVEPAGHGSGGWLVAGRPGAGPVVAASRPPDDDAPGTQVAQPWWAQWEATGSVAGAGVVTGRPVGLFDVVQGDHVVRAPAGADGGPAAGGGPQDALAWWSSTGSAGLLPVPAALRPVDGLAGEVEVHGALVPVGADGADAALLLLDGPVARLLGGHLARRLPGGADDLAPDGAVASLACRWPAHLDPALLPDPGTRVWVRGVLVAAPGLTVTGVRGIAWARTVSGEPVVAAPDEPGWPGDVVVWRVLTWGPGGAAASGAGRVADRAAERAAQSLAWALPLPARDGERGSATTFTRLRETVAAAAAVRASAGAVTGPGAAHGGTAGLPAGPEGATVRGRAAVAAVVPPSIVRDVRTGRRALRLVGTRSAGAGAGPVLDGVTVRVHVRD